MARINLGRAVTSGALLALLAGCADGQNPFKGGGEASRGATPDLNSVRLVDRDVEAPDVFQVAESGLWDGRPSLGGVWVAYPDVAEPERVLIRNEANGKFVIGALFRRERENPGPAFQVSSDAAAALEMLAGAPASLNVTALRREEVPIATETVGEGVETASATTPGDGAIEATTLDTEATAATAAAAIAAAETRGPTAPPTAVVTPASASATATPPRGSGLSKPYIQIGLFSVEANAKGASDAMRRAGVIPVIKPGTASGKPYWRVLIGPAATSPERAALLKKVKGMGYADAYFVRN